MNKTYTRRDSLKLMGSAVVTSQLIGARGLSAVPLDARRTDRGPAVPAADMRGIFVILSTPYTDSGAVDYDDLAFQVEWLDTAGNSDGHISQRQLVVWLLRHSKNPAENRLRFQDAGTLQI